MAQQPSIFKENVTTNVSINDKHGPTPDDSIFQ
jgi:hypothetical protein